MQYKLFISILIITILSSMSVLAVDFAHLTSYDEFSRQIPEFNEFLEETPLILAPIVLRVVNNEDVAIHVKTHEGHIESFVISIYENYVTKIIAGPQPTKLYIELDETTIDEIIQNPNSTIEYYKNGKIQVKSTSATKRIKLFFFKTLAKWFA